MSRSEPLSKSKNCGYSRSLVALAACLGCGFFGVTMFFWGSMLPTIRESITGVDNLPWVLTGGIIAGTAICGAVMDRYGYKWLLVLSSLALACGLSGFIFTQNLPLLYISTFLIGAGGGVLNSETIAIISDIYDDSKRGSMLSILGGSYCLGSLLWTIICRLLVYDYTLPMKWSAIVIALFALLFVFIKFPPAKLSKGEGPSLLQSIKLLKYNILALVALLLFFQGALEAVSANFSTSYYTFFADGIGLDMALTSLIFMTVGMAVGRFTLPLCMKIGGNVLSIYLFLFIALCGVLLQLFMPINNIAAFASMTLIGFGTGATAPVVFNYLGKVFKRYSGAAVSISVIIAQIGMLIGNYGIGRSGMFRLFPLVMVVLIAAVMAIFPFVVRSSQTPPSNNL